MARKFGYDVTVMKVGTIDVWGVFQNCKLSQGFDTDFSRATKDTGDATIKGFERHVPKERGWSVELGLVVESEMALMAAAITGGPLDIYITRPGGTSTGATYKGTAVFTECSLDNPDGASLEGATLEGTGVLGQAAAP